MTQHSGQRGPVGCEVDDRLAPSLLAHLAVWLTHSVLAGHRPPSAWLDRGVKSFLQLRLPAAVLPTVRAALEEEAHVISIGIDPHKSSHTAVAFDEAGHVLGELRVPANKATLRRLRSWAGTWPERTWAIEGAGGLGHLLAQQLVAAGEVAVDVPAAFASDPGARDQLVAGDPGIDKRESNHFREARQWHEAIPDAAALGHVRRTAANWAEPRGRDDRARSPNARIAEWRIPPEATGLEANDHTRRGRPAWARDGATSWRRLGRTTFSFQDGGTPARALTFPETDRDSLLPRS